jgi:glutamine synthetase
MSATFENFSAGIIHNLPALMQFLAPHHNSIRRLLPGCFAGNYHFWGYDNKEAPLRVTQPLPNQGVTDIELKSFDHTANMYLAFAATIACGIYGIRNGMKLPPPCIGDPSLLTEEVRQQRNIQVLPHDFSERKEFILYGSKVDNSIGKPIRELFTPRALRNYLAI